MSKGKKKPRRRGQADPATLVEDDIEETVDNHKTILELFADELKKEAFKLGLYTEGDKPRKEQALTKLTDVLSRIGLNIETVKLSPNGTTKFPAPLLSENRHCGLRRTLGQNVNI